ncbi:MAG: hypothetical protein PF569_01485 [Candidatus Woesearchaeota archaeon]|jgi:hypothetical protein|nr:hypothetical protein [Candidatus Woesearchaeota archaeon]
MDEWTKEERQHIEDVADDYGVSHDTAYYLAELLGRNELRDGFMTSMQDIEEGY